MFWWGRVNAMLVIGTLALAVFFALTGDWMAFGGTWFAAIILRVALGFLNLVVTAVSGTPLFYETKLLDKRRGDRDA